MFLSFLYVTTCFGALCLVKFMSVCTKLWSESINPHFTSVKIGDDIESMNISKWWFNIWVGKFTWFLKSSPSRVSMKVFVSGCVKSSIWMLKLPVKLRVPLSVLTFSSSRDMNSLQNLITLLARYLVDNIQVDGTDVQTYWCIYVFHVGGKVGPCMILNFDIISVDYCYPTTQSIIQSGMRDDTIPFWWYFPVSHAISVCLFQPCFYNCTDIHPFC